MWIKSIGQWARNLTKREATEKKFVVLEACFNGDEHESFKTGWIVFGAYESFEQAEAQRLKEQKKHKSVWADIFPDVVNMVSHKVVELEESSALHLVWNIEEEAPYLDEENLPFGDFLQYGASRLAADKLALKCIERTIPGNLETLSKRPEELKALIDSEPGLRLVKDSIVINAKTGAAALPMLNALLNDPLYEIRKLTPGEVMEMEAELTQVKEI